VGVEKYFWAHPEAVAAGYGLFETAGQRRYIEDYDLRRKITPWSIVSNIIMRPYTPHSLVGVKKSTIRNITYGQD
jgi:hypothetical protein